MKGDIKSMAKGACRVLNKLAYKTYGLANVDYKNVAAEASDLPKHAWDGKHVIRFYFTDEKGFHYRIFK